MVPMRFAYFWLLLSHVHAENILRIIAKYDNDSGGASALWLRGSTLGLSWDKGVPMTQSNKGTFFVDLQIPKNFSDVDVMLEFKTLANEDSLWQLGGNSLATVEAGTATIFPWFEAQTGQYFVAARDVPCNFFHNKRDVVVYLPAPALENTHADARWETLVMHDGENVFNASTSFGGVSWQADVTIDVEVAEGNMRPIAIVAPYNTADRIAEYTPVPDPQYDGGQGDHYLDWITEELLPLLATKYKLATDRDNLGLLGSSLGGLISCYAGYTRRDYGRVGCMSSSFWWDNQYFNNTLLENTPPAAKDTHIYLDSGDQPAPDGDDELETIGVRDHLQRLGWTLGDNLFYHLQHGGEHNEVYWAKRFHLPMCDLYPRRSVTVSAN